MGQGYSVIHPSAGSAGIDSPEVADLEYERTLVGARFLKTIRARHRDGVVVAKIYTKPFGSLKLNDRVHRLVDERRQLSEVPNALPYHRIVETSTSAFLIRQFVHSSLYDRISTNPPLEDIERKWIAFQLLCAVRDCHARNIYHGDIKTENMLVTSWNWLYLTDFAANIKPHFLPEDNPVDFSLFYDTTVRRICYIAPERFNSSSEDHDQAKHHGLTWAMDIFSVGCVIAELFTEKPTFTLSQLFQYRRGEYDPAQSSIGAVRDSDVRELILHMIKVDPNDRYSAQEYLDFWKERAFPSYFYNFLHQYTHLITDPTSGQRPHIASKTNAGGSDDRIDRIYNDYDKISYALGFDSDIDIDEKHRSPDPLNLHLFPLQVDIPSNRHTAANRVDADSDNGALLFSNIVIASLRSTIRASSRLKGLELLLTFSEHLTDEAKLDRVLPYAIALLEDEVPAVRISAIRTITQMLALVTVLSPMNAFVFPRYILPRLSKFVSSTAFLENPPIRATYAACLSDLALTASRFLDMTQALRADGSLPSIDPEAEDDVAAYAAYQLSYDVTREELVQQFEAQTKMLLTDPESSVRRAFLGSVGGLCVFFGDSLASDLILTHLNTYLNDEDWTLRCALCETIVGVAAYIGGSSLEDFILPLLVQALTDPEEFVTEQVIRAFASMAKLGLLSRWIMLELMLIVVRFTLHPNHWIREAAAQFLSNSAAHLSYADFRSLSEPLLRPVFKLDTPDSEEITIMDALKKPLARPTMDLAKVWATRTDKGVFWKAAQRAKSFSFDANSHQSLMELYQGITPTTPIKASKNEEDSQWMTRLRNSGMKTDDEPKLLALRDYLWRIVLRSEKEKQGTDSTIFNHIVSLTTLRVPLQNVLFEEDLQYYDQIANRDVVRPPPRAATLKEALKEAASAESGDIQSQSTSLSRTLTVRPRVEDERPSSSRTASDISSAPGPPQTVNTFPRMNPGRKSLNPAETALSSSPASQMSTGSGGHRHPPRHRESAINLMKRTDAVKAGAETSTDSANAVGRLDIPVSGRGTPVSSTPVDPTSGANVPHSYAGHDPNVQHHLDNTYINGFPIDLADFGPRVQSVKRAQIPTSTGQDSSGRWKPQGLLIAAIGEHGGQINCMAVAPDHIFWITGCEDGSVRIFDTSRLERNITHRPRQAHHHRGGAAISALCFIESTHSFISSAIDGSVNIVKVDVTNSAGTTRYGKLQVLRDWSIADAVGPDLSASEGETEHVIALEHFRADNQSLCLMLTSSSRIIALDLKHMEVLYTFSSPQSHGAPTCFCMHRRRQWLLIGTTHGVLDLWDVRFRLRLRSWTFKSPHPITKISLHPGRRSGHRMRVGIAGGTGTGHVSIWDIEKLICHEIYIATTDNIPEQKLSQRDFELVPVPEDSDADHTQLDRFITRPAVSQISSPNPAATPPRPSAVSAGSQQRISHKQSVPGTVRDFVMQMHLPTEGQIAVSEARHHFVLTAGPDWKTRYWDSEKPKESAIVNSGAIEPFSTASTDEQISVSTSLLGAETRVFVDNGGSADASSTSATGTGSATSSPAKRRVERSLSSVTTSKGSVDGQKTTRYDVIRNSAHHLLRGHRDEITCMVLLERPFGMVVTGDRSGGMYVFQ